MRSEMCDLSYNSQILILMNGGVDYLFGIVQIFTTLEKNDVFLHHECELFDRL